MTDRDDAIAGIHRSDQDRAAIMASLNGLLDQTGEERFCECCNVILKIASEKLDTGKPMELAEALMAYFALAGLNAYRDYLCTSILRDCDENGDDLGSGLDDLRPSDN